MFPGNISGNEELTLSNEINFMISLDKEMNIKIYQKLCAESKILCCLIFGYNVNGHILHIVVGCDNINIYIITAYYPDTKKFENDLKTRRKR